MNTNIAGIKDSIPRIKPRFPRRRPRPGSLAVIQIAPGVLAYPQTIDTARAILAAYPGAVLVALTRDQAAALGVQRLADHWP